MHGVILAAGEGARMGERTADRPKTFLEIDGRTLYEHQRAALAPHVDAITVVLGYEAASVRDRLAAEDRALRFEEWREYENGESLRRALAALLGDDGAGAAGENVAAGVSGDGSGVPDGGGSSESGPGDPDEGVVVLNGDVVVPPSVVGSLVAGHREAGASVVGCLPDRQTDHTALQCDSAGRVTDYGMIPGYRHAGVGVISGTDLQGAERVLRDHRTDWYPVVYPALDARRAVVPGECHVEVNRPAHLRAARERLPFGDDAPCHRCPLG